MNTLKLSRGRKNSSNNYSESAIVVAAYVPSSGLRVVLRALVVVVVVVLDRSVAPEVHSSDDQRVCAPRPIAVARARLVVVQVHALRRRRLSCF